MKNNLKNTSDKELLHSSQDPYIKVSSSLAAKFPGLLARLKYIENVNIDTVNPKLEDFKDYIFKETKKKWRLEDLKENKKFRAYRDFFWRVKVDPTKIRPASEALTRRVLKDSPIPRINTLVDAYNLASITTGIPFAVFDSTKLTGEPFIREAKFGEQFLGIGMDKPITLEGGEAVIQDTLEIIAVYPYRDADHSKVTEAAKSILLLTCGVPGITKEQLHSAENVAIDYITKYCDGKPS